MNIKRKQTGEKRKHIKFTPGITIHIYKFVVFGPPRPNHNKPNEILKKLNEHQEETKGNIKNTHQIHPAASQYTFIRFVCSDRLVQITTNPMEPVRNQMSIKDIP